MNNEFKMLILTQNQISSKDTHVRENPSAHGINNATLTDIQFVPLSTAPLLHAKNKDNINNLSMDNIYSFEQMCLAWAKESIKVSDMCSVR